MPPESRAGLGTRKLRRPHPASPAAVSDAVEAGNAPPRNASGASGDEELVMLCVRIAPSLRRRLKLIAASSGRSVQALAAEALEAVCRHHDM
jgi:predicted HicB family RNase H-like nuclease